MAGGRTGCPGNAAPWLCSPPRCAQHRGAPGVQTRRRHRHLPRLEIKPCCLPLSLVWNRLLRTKPLERGRAVGEAGAEPALGVPVLGTGTCPRDKHHRGCRSTRWKHICTPLASHFRSMGLPGWCRAPTEQDTGWRVGVERSVGTAMATELKSHDCWSHDFRGFSTAACASFPASKMG